jgi:hypothetical protein
LVIFPTGQFEEGNKTQKELNEAIRLKFTDTNCLRTKKQAEVSKRFVRKFNSKKGKHWFNGLDREMVYVRDSEVNVVPVLDGSF